MKNWIITAIAIGLIIVAAIAFINKPATNQNVQLDNDSQGPSELKWYTDMNLAISEAQNNNKSIFALFYTDWCPGCQEIQSNTLSNDDVKQKLAQKYVSVKIDTDNNPQLSSEYGIYGLPTIIIMDSNGKEITRLLGYQSPEDLLNLL
ncbi:thioredoxin family protein [Methanobacterium alcaliphilum]|uniref:thioredoxin family protein n=1 Tax=Methanobacterium alcaliphilum TaxID=392018 RepID=UPI00200B45F3|nr:thioredoxin fold domain-containing protein [Methanobacterium alcaliphilum]MCK9152143.1 thioredoxin fold domain-containing protein [Methanobacterium alcaliphilum]